MRKGFTLVELSVAFGIALVAFLILVSTYGDYSQIYRHQEETMTSSRDAQIFFSTFKDEIRGRGSSHLKFIDVSGKVLKRLGYPGDPLQFWQEKHVMGFRINKYQSYEGSIAWTQTSTYIRQVQQAGVDSEGNPRFRLVTPGEWKPSLRDSDLDEQLRSLSPDRWRHVPWPDPAKPKIDFFLLKRHLVESGEATITYAYYHTKGFPYPPRTLVRVATDLVPEIGSRQDMVVLKIGEGRIREDFWLQPMIEVAAWPIPSTGRTTYVIPKRYVHAHAAFEEAEGGRFTRRSLVFDMRLATNL